MVLGHACAAAVGGFGVQLWRAVQAGGYVPAFTFAQYLNLPARWKAFENTLTLAPIGTVVVPLIAYPLAYFLALHANPKWRTLLLILVIVPFWTSILIRSYAWIFILGGRGIPALLYMGGLGGIRVINTRFAVLVGIVYGYLPLMVFAIFLTLNGWTNACLKPRLTLALFHQFHCRRQFSRSGRRLRHDGRFGAARDDGPDQSADCGGLAVGRARPAIGHGVRVADRGAYFVQDGVGDHHRQGPDRRDGP